MNWASHLSDSARQMLLCSIEDRAAFVATQEYIPTTDGVAALQWLSYLRRHAFGVDRPRNQHVVAAPGMGKSRVLKHYASKFEPTRNPSGVLQREVVLVEAPEDGELAHMRGSIARACLPGLQANAYYSTEEVIEILVAAGVRQLLLDEMGNVLNGSRSSQLRVLALLKRITNMGITVGIATTENLRFVLAADDQLKSRFHITMLRPWGETEELRAFLDAVEMQLPLLSPSHLASPDVVRCLLSRDCHSTSDILDPIRDACRMAFYENAPCISIPTLKQAIEAVFPPDGGMEAAG